MNTLAIWVDKQLQKDEIFNAQSAFNRDNCLSKYRLLKSYLELDGWQVHTQDYFEKSNVPNAVLFLEVPDRKVEVLLSRWNHRTERIRTHVILSECEVVEPRNWKYKLHDQFDSIFTWKNSLVDNKRYFHINFVSSKIDIINVENNNKNKLCTLISGNKTSAHSLELYSKRVEVIRWFEKNNPVDFDLFGTGWERYVSTSSRWIRVLFRIKWINKLFYRPYSSYLGKVNSKFETMAKYKYAICFENAVSIPDYITEKIFDCFASGCVPIYLGAPNICDKIPSGCFIDARKFPDYEALHQHLVEITSNEYDNYIENIRNYMRSSAFHAYTKEYFAKSIKERVVNGT